jgi:hypothetical protein
VVAVLVAVTIPLLIEATRRPSLSIRRGSDLDDDHWRVVHVRILNEPIPGLRGRLLLRHSAAGCEVRMTLRSRSDEKEMPSILCKWSAAPEPLEHVVRENALESVPDAQKIGSATRYEVQPGGEGEPVAVAIKHDGERRLMRTESDSISALATYGIQNLSSPILSTTCSSRPLRAKARPRADLHFEMRAFATPACNLPRNRGRGCRG